MDSPILNEFLAHSFAIVNPVPEEVDRFAHSFAIVDPVPEEVDWFYIEEDKVIRHFTYSTNGECWTEVTRPVNEFPDSSSEGQTNGEGWTEVTRPVNEFPDSSSEGQCFTNFISTDPVHPGHENVIPDGLRMHPVTEPISLEPCSDEEWESLDLSDEDLWSFLVSDVRNITTLCEGDFELLTINDFELLTINEVKGGKAWACQQSRHYHPHNGTCPAEKVVGWLKHKLAKK